MRRFRERIKKWFLRERELFFNDVLHFRCDSRLTQVLYLLVVVVAVTIGLLK